MADDSPIWSFLMLVDARKDELAEHAVESAINLQVMRGTGLAAAFLSAFGVDAAIAARVLTQPGRRRYATLRPCPAGSPTRAAEAHSVPGS